MYTFEKLKGYLALTLVLQYYNPSLPTKIEINTLDRVIAGVISQQLNKE
jgi:hypothetical protein